MTTPTTVLARIGRLVRSAGRARAQAPARWEGLEPLEQRAMLSLSIDNPVNDLTINRGSIPVLINLANRYTDPTVSHVVRFVTNSGNMDIALFGGAAPNTVANFLAYVNAGTYDNTIFHRGIDNGVNGNTIGVLQGGGFRTPTATYTTFPPSAAATPQPVTTNAPIALENPTGNVRGSIGMARTNELNSATSQFFFNTANNSALLDDPTPGTPSEGFAVFGRLLPQSLTVLDALDAFVATDFEEDFGNGNGVWSNLPLRTPPNQQGFVPLPIAPSAYLQITDAQVLGGIFGQVTVTSSNLNLVTASVNGGSLILSPVGTALGTATITVRVTDVNGNFVEDSFDVTITNPAPVVGGVQGQAGVAVGSPMLLSAYGVRDTDATGGGVSSVEFFRDVNNDGQLDAGDTSLGIDGASAGGWNLRADTTGWAVGANRVFARVTDSEGATAVTSRIVTLRAAVQQGTITPGNPNPGAGENVSVTVGGVDGTNRRLSIWLDTDGNGSLNPLTDRLLGFATFDAGSGNWFFTVNGQDLEAGANRIFSRTTDAGGNLGGIGSADITVS